jgi:hypothetical protein
MSILQEIPLQAIPNQTLSIVINDQTFNITLNSLYINNKELQNNTPSYEPTNTVIGGVNIQASTLYTMVNVSLESTPIIYNVLANNCVYINQFPSSIIGYLFFYVDNWGTNGDTINYTNFGDGGTTHLYYSDYDALSTTFDDYVTTNQFSLRQRFIYGTN